MLIVIKKRIESYYKKNKYIVFTDGRSMGHEVRRVFYLLKQHIMAICNYCGGRTSSRSKYCHSCKKLKDNAYSVLNKCKKRIIKLCETKGYDEYRFIKLGACLEAMKPQREVLARFIDKDLETLKQQKENL